MGTSTKKFLGKIMVIIMVFFNLNSVMVKNNVGAQEIPSLWVTEIMPDSLQDSGVNVDQYEYIEIYNAGSEPINMKDYSIRYIYPTDAKPLTWDITEDKILLPKDTMVIWNKNTNHTNKTIDDFNRTYSVNLKDNQICAIVSGGMANSGERTIAIQRDDEVIISTATYNKDNIKDVAANKSIIYGAPDAGSGMMKKLASGVKPNPGTQPPIVKHSQTIESTPLSDIIIEAGIYEENIISSAKVYYRTSLESGFSYVNMNQDETDAAIYKATIPKENIGFVKFLQYYIQVIDESNTITLPEIQGAYYNIAIEQSDRQYPVIEHNQIITTTKPTDIAIEANVSDDTQVSCVKLYYKTSKMADFNFINMTLIDGIKYRAMIPINEISDATWIQYYIEATDGINTGSLPQAISTPFNINIIQADNQPPLIQHTQNSTSLPLDDILIRATITDNNQVSGTRLYYKTNKMNNYRFIDMTEDPQKKSEFEVVIPRAELIGSTSVQYYIEATDGINNVTLPDQIGNAYNINIQYETPELLIPELLITEMLPNPSQGPNASGDVYEFIEIYNPTNHPINLKDYQFIFYPTPEDRRVNDITEDKIVQPRNTMVIWIYNKDSKTYNKNLNDFNQFYSVNLSEDQLYIMDVTLPGMFNLYNSVPARTIILTKDNGDLVCRATYSEGATNDAVTDKSIIYTYPQVGSFDMIKIGTVIDPTVGTVIIDQIPPNYNDRIPPVVEHDQKVFSMAPSDLKIQAKVYDDENIRSVKLWYKTSKMSLPLSINMVRITQDQDIFEAIISTAEIDDAVNLQYYIEATDGVNTITSPGTPESYYTIKIGDVLGPVISGIYPFDKFYLENEYRPLISAKYTDSSEVNTAKVKLFLDGEDVTSRSNVSQDNVTYRPESELTAGEYIVKIQVYDKSESENFTEMLWSFEVGPEIFNQYQGQIHSHTVYSDGQGTPDEAYIWARDNGKADFFGLTDHSNYFDFDGKAWKELRDFADKYNEPGKYATIPGYEMTWDGNTGFWGHMNVFNTEWSVSRQNLDMSMPKLYEKLSETPGSLGQFNHPVFYWGDFADFGHYSEDADKAMNLIELKSLTNDWLYSRALDKGWHISPSNNEDNHSKAWMTASSGATVVIAPKLTRENILEAFGKNRTYSTMDRNLRIQYKINGKILGSKLIDPDMLSFDIELSDADENIGKVTVVADGGSIVATRQFNTKSTKWEFELPAEYTYYYLRVEQADGNLAVTAPIWVESSKPVTISETKLALKDWDQEKPIQAISFIKNNESFAVEDVKVEFFFNSTLDVNKIGEVSLGTLNGGDEKTAVMDLPAIDGKRTVYTRVSASAGGRSKKAVTYINVPTLIITEVMPNTSADPGETGNPYEFVEIYNNSNQPVNLKDYKLVFYTGTNAFTDFDIARDKIIPARGTMVLWIKSSDMHIQVKQLADFNNHYGTNLQKEQVLEVNGSLDNTGGKMIFIAKDSGEKLNYATYNLYLDLNRDTVLDRSITYSYPQNGTDQSIKVASNQLPSPGVILTNQVPAVITNEKAIVSVNSLADITLVKGAALSLPSTVTVKYNDNSTSEAIVSWLNSEIVDVNTPNTYVVSGTVDGFSGSITIKVIVTEVEKDFTINSSFNLSSLQANKMLEVQTIVTNNKSSLESVLVIVALFDGNDKMINVSYISKDIPKGYTENLNAGFKLPSDVTSHKVKVFVWEGTSLNTSSMQPLSNVVVLQ